MCNNYNRYYQPRNIYKVTQIQIRAFKKTRVYSVKQICRCIFVYSYLLETIIFPSYEKLPELDETQFRSQSKTT